MSVHKSPHGDPKLDVYDIIRQVVAVWETGQYHCQHAQLELACLRGEKGSVVCSGAFFSDGSTLPVD